MNFNSESFDVHIEPVIPTEIWKMKRDHGIVWDREKALKGETVGSESIKEKLRKMGVFYLEKEERGLYIYKGRKEG